MKQNERLLVYAVTGFLAVILVVAVVFGNDPARASGRTGDGALGLEDILNGERLSPKAGDDLAGGEGAATGTEGAPTDTLSGLKKPEDVTPAGPLVVKPQLAADLVAQHLGASRRERMVRWVRAKNGDSLETLVRRWCGARDPYLAEARSLNEELTVLRIGQEVMVPWVDDEQLLAVIEASKPRVLTPDQAGTEVPQLAGGQATAPDFQMPRTLASQPDLQPRGNAPAPTPLPTGDLPVAGESYVVKPGDSLWRIAAKRWGTGKADRMIQEIKRLNPGLTDSIKAGQSFLLPAGPSQ